MNKYTIIADISNHICSLLKNNMTPEPILNEEFIGMCTPSDKGDLNLGVYLYDIKESEEIRSATMINRGVSSQKFPPTYLTLYYMITAYSNTEIKFKYLDDQKILGRVIQIISDNSIIDVASLVNSTNLLMPESRIQLLNLSNEDKTKIWNAPNTPYRLSICISVSPIELESTRVRNIQRVTEAITNIQEK